MQMRAQANTIREQSNNKKENAGWQPSQKGEGKKKVWPPWKQNSKLISQTYLIECELGQGSFHP